jgi:hypothetical protein
MPDERIRPPGWLKPMNKALMAMLAPPMTPR